MIEPTLKQIDFLTVLFQDCNFSRAERNAYLSGLVMRDIHYLDDLSRKECSIAIAELIKMKENKNG